MHENPTARAAGPKGPGSAETQQHPGMPEGRLSPQEMARKTIDNLAPGPTAPRASIPTKAITLPDKSVAVIREIPDEAERFISMPALMENDEGHEQWLCLCLESLNGRGPVTPADTLVLYTGARAYLDVAIVQFSYGNEIEYVITCPDCGHASPMCSDLQKILDTSTDYPDQREFEVVLPSGRVATYGFLTGIQENAMRAKKKKLSMVDPVAMRLRTLDKHGAGSGALGELVPKDRAALRLEMGRNPGGGPDVIVSCICDGCHKPVMTTIQNCLSFFLPGLR